MRFSRRRSLKIHGWICMAMVWDIVRGEQEKARANHTQPIPVQENDALRDSPPNH